MNLVPEHIRLLYIPPFQDESLASWMNRLTNSHFTDLKTYFADRIEQRALLRTDFDLLQDRSVLAEITRFTPLSTEEVVDLTIYNNRLFPFSILADKLFVPWLLPRPSKHSKSFGLQVCPSCWFKDTIAYHRVDWRLSLLFFCRKCRVYLIDHCPSCNYPIIHSPTSYLRFIEDPLNIQRFCFNCKWDLACSEQLKLSRKDSETADRVLELFENEQHLPCSLENYLIILHYFTQRFYSEHQRTNKMFLTQRKDRSKFLEINSITRANLIANAFDMFDDFPDNAIRSKQNHLSVKAFWLKGFEEPPEWYRFNLRKI